MVSVCGGGINLLKKVKTRVSYTTAQLALFNDLRAKPHLTFN